MICRRCGHEHAQTHCPVCGQPRPDQIATAQQRAAHRQRLHVTAVLPPQVAAGARQWLQQADHLAETPGQVLATYREGNFTPFFQLWQVIADQPGCELLFNGQRRPYDRELWIPLMWIAEA